MSIEPVSTANGRYFSRIPEQLSAPGRRNPEARNFDASLAAAERSDPREDLQHVDSARPSAGGGPLLRMIIDPSLLPQSPEPSGDARTEASEAASPSDGAPPRSEHPSPAAPAPSPSGPVLKADVPSANLTTEEEDALFAVARTESRHLAQLRERARQEDRAARPAAKSPTLDDPPSQVARAVSEQASQVVQAATGQIGRSYRPGGSSPKSGFDCSGLTNWAFAKIGLDLPRSSREQFQEGKPVAREDLRKGDLVFFGSKNRVSHVGVYIDNGEFIHASSGYSTVKVSSLGDAAWDKLFIGARRHF